MGYHIIEARWDAHGDKQFAEIDASPVVGDLAEAQATAAAYLTQRAARQFTQLLWIPGLPDKRGAVYYASHSLVTFRIRQ